MSQPRLTSLPFQLIIYKCVEHSNTHSGGVANQRFWGEVLLNDVSMQTAAPVPCAGHAISRFGECEDGVTGVAGDPAKCGRSIAQRGWSVARITFGINLPPVLSCRKLISVIAQLEALGFDQVVMPDHLLFPERFGAPDVWSILAAAAYRTKRVQLGTCVSDPHRQHPVVLAQRAATIDHLSEGRFILGLGAGEAMNIEPFGIPANRPVARLKESVRIVRHLLDRDEPLDFEGEFFELHRAQLDIRPRQPRLPMALAAHGPLMLKFTGEVADGWWPSMVPPEFYGELHAAVERAASAAGRGGTVVPSVWIALFLTDDEKFVRRVARRGAAAYIWPESVQRLGITLPVAADVAATNYWNVNPLDPASVRRLEAHCAALPEDFILSQIKWGNVRKVRRLLGEYVDAGVRHFQITNFSPDQTASIVTLASEVIPYFTRRPASLVARVTRALLPLLPRDAESKAAVRKYLDPP